MTTTDEVRKSGEIQRQTYSLAVDFIRLELGLSRTFAEAALNADSGSEKRLRNQANAVKGYHTIRHFLRKYPAASESEQFRTELLSLKERLEALGEKELQDFDK